MAHSAVWGHAPIQRQPQIQKSCLRAISEGAQIKDWLSSFK